jgi:hypothetical protein
VYEAFVLRHGVAVRDERAQVDLDGLADVALGLFYRACDRY